MLIDQSLTPLTANQIVATRLEIARVTGDTTTGSRLVEEQSLMAVDAITYAREDAVIATVRYLLAQNQANSAHPLLARLASMAQADGRNGSLIKLLALQAAAYQAQGQTESALSRLDSALALAGSEGFVRSFLDAGPHLVGLLVTMKNEGRGPQETIQALLDASPGSTTSDLSASTPQPLIEPLTEREQEVLSLVAAGLSNRAIAQELIVAVGTVKTHVNRIMGKLDADNRTQAVARARELGIFP